MGFAAVTIAGMRVLVLGTGVAGTSAVAACNELGAIPTTVDANGTADHLSVAELDLSTFHVAMASAAFAPHSEAIQACQAAGLEIWSEMEFAWRIRRPDIPWVLVTGTNGKTTTTQMVGAIAAAGGLDVRVCGNMGIPVIEAARAACDLVAVEIASLQLHFTHTLSPHAAVCLNADDDHTDWHGSVEAYHADKARVFRHARVACVYPAGEQHIERMVEEADVVDGCRAVGVTLGVPAVSQLGVVETHLVDRAFHEARRTEAVELASIADLAHLVAGDVPPYLTLNALAAAALCRAVGVEPEAVREGLAGFGLDHHRTAFVATVDGVAYVDDSKATNAHAVRAAFGGFGPGSVVWIAGGLAKGQDFGDLVREIHGKVAGVVVIGEDQQPLATALAEHAADIPVVAIAPGETVMERAVEAARSLASAGQTVLLSPASASMDQFRDYADRGNAFAAKVRAMEDR